MPIQILFFYSNKIIFKLFDNFIQNITKWVIQPLAKTQTSILNNGSKHKTKIMMVMEIP